MPVKTVDVENVHPHSAQDVAGMGLQPGQREELEVSSTHYFEIAGNTNLLVHSESDWSDHSEVPVPADPEAVAAAREERREYQSAVRDTNNAYVQDNRAYNNAAGKATQLGINLDDVEVRSLDGRVTLQDVVRHQSELNRPHEGIVEGGARQGTRAGEALVEGQVANYRPVSGFPHPVQDGQGKPANEGHTRVGIQVNTEGQPVRDRDEPMKAVGSQDEYKALAPEETAHSESAPSMGIDSEHPEGNQETRTYVGGVPVEGYGESVYEEYRREQGLDPVPGASRPDGFQGVQESAERIETGSGGSDPSKVTPSAQERADELGVDPTQATGTGKDGAVLKRDVEKLADEQGQKQE